MARWSCYVPQVSRSCLCASSSSDQRFFTQWGAAFCIECHGRQERQCQASYLISSLSLWRFSSVVSAALSFALSLSLARLSPGLTSYWASCLHATSSLILSMEPSWLGQSILPTATRALALLDHRMQLARLWVSCLKWSSRLHKSWENGAETSPLCR